MGKTLIIAEADFSQNAINDVVIVDNAEYALLNGFRLEGTSYPLKLNAYNQRANVLVTRSSVDNPCSWQSGSAAEAQTYSIIPIPNGATLCTISCTNTAYYYGLVVWGISGERLYDSGWKNGGETSCQISNYTGAIYISSTIKKGSAGTDSFTSETLQSIGWSIHWA